MQTLDDTGTSKEYLTEMAQLFKQKRYKDGRKLVCSQVNQDEIEEVFTFLYQNLNLFSDTDSGQEKAIVIIAEGLRDNTFCTDSELNLAATLVKLSNIDE